MPDYDHLIKQLNCVIRDPDVRDHVIGDLFRICSKYNPELGQWERYFQICVKNSVRDYWRRQTHHLESRRYWYENYNPEETLDENLIRLGWSLEYYNRVFGTLEYSDDLNPASPTQEYTESFYDLLEMWHPNMSDLDLWVLEMRFIEGKTFSEIARILNRTKSVIVDRERRVLNRIRKKARPCDEQERAC